MQYLQWALINFTILIGFTIGSIADIHWLVNLIAVFIWVSSIVSLALFSPAVIKEVLRQDHAPISVPYYIDLLFDITLLAVLLIFQHWALAILYIAHMAATYKYSKAAKHLTTKDHHVSTNP